METTAANLDRKSATFAVRQLSPALGAMISVRDFGTSVRI
jgi:hypothetical protein